MSHHMPHQPSLPAGRAPWRDVVYSPLWSAMQHVLHHHGAYLEVVFDEQHQAVDVFVQQDAPAMKTAPAAVE
jgi:hypothetical protein